MTRQALSTASRAENAGQIVREVVFIKIPFPSGTVLISSSDRNHTWDGDTYVPAAIGGVDGISENLTGAEEMPVLHLSGVDSGLLTKCMNDAVFRLPVQVAIGDRDDTGALVDTPEIVFNGYLNYPTFNFNQQQGALDINLMTLNSIMKRVSRLRGCNADQQSRFATDTAFNQVTVNPNRKVQFGNSQHTPGTGINHPEPSPGKGAVTPTNPFTPDPFGPKTPLDPNTVFQ